ncbi:MAG: cytochrome c-type biogenesis protein CcmH [Deltaproteobacteria bacterium]|nr:cytochrome c-type biogenesis protein CcmH [Deltaproteobacteria bacterium]
MLQGMVRRRLGRERWTLLGILVVSSCWGATRVALADEDDGPRRPPTPPVDWVMKALGVSADETPSLTEEQRRVADDAGQRLVSLCPDCRPSTITEEGPCGWARVNRRVIRNAVALGRSADQIVDTYVAVYGQRILAVPKDHGFAAASWAVPYAAAVLSLAFLFVLGRRLRRRAESTDAPRDPAMDGSRRVAGAEGADDDDQKALQSELASLD